MRQWLERELDSTYVPALRKIKPTAQGRAKVEELLQSMRNNWAKHGLKTLKQQQGCMDQVRRKIKDSLGDEHWSLDIIKFSRDEYVNLNDQKQNQVAKRNESIQQIDAPESIVAQAVRLIIESPEWADIAAGLAVLTGRRASELLGTGAFEKKTKWSVVFTGAVKRGEEQGLAFEIPTLTTADRVIAALEKIRRELPQAATLSPRDINKTFEPAVARACDKHFAHLIPTREGKDNLYTHLFRAVYATIACFWYCPPTVNETEFRAAIQGHFQILDETNRELKRSLAASRHYSDYEIGDKVIAQHNGRRKGIKLGLSGIEVIEMFKDSVEKAERKKTSGKTRKKTPSSVRMYKEDKVILERLFDRLNLDVTTRQEERLRALLEWLDANMSVDNAVSLDEDGRTEVQQQSQEPSPSVETTSQLVSEDPLRSDLQALTSTLKDFLTLMKDQMLQPAQPLNVATPSQKDLTPAEAPSELHNGAASATPKLIKQRKNLTKEKTITRVNQAIDAIMAYNDTPGRLHDEKWAITINALKTWVTSAPTIMEVLDARKDQIQSHHHHHHIDPAKQNYKHRAKRNIDQVITLPQMETVAH